jgi:hypothetical protein
MSRRVITKEARVRQIVQGASLGDLEASVKMAIANLQSQIQALHRAITELKKTDNAGAGPDGTTLPGVNSPVTAVLTNASGAGRNEGEVAVRCPSDSGAFTVTARANDATVAGVVYEDSADGESDAIAAGAQGRICVGGPARVLVDADAGAISPGDYLVTHSADGYAARAAERDAQGVFAVALEGLASGTGLIAAIIAAESLVTAETFMSLKSHERAAFERDGCLVPHYDGDGGATGFSGYVASATLWTDDAMSAVAAHWTFGYDTAGLLASAVHSVYDLDGAGLATIRRAIEYQDERISKIVAEIEAG